MTDIDALKINAVFPEYRTPRPPRDLSPEAARQVRAFHQTLPGYAPTPLCRLPGLAEALGVRQIYVKDESPRFGLNAFKALGATWAVAQILCRELGMDPATADFSLFSREEVKEKISGMSFYTATDGNHGRGLAWAARLLGCKAFVFMPRGSVRIRVDNIRAQGAEVRVTDVNYDNTVRMAASAAKANRGFLVQDTAFDGYEEVPAWVVQGYTTMAGEVPEQIRAFHGPLPTHLFLQAGVGSMPASVLGFYANALGRNCPDTFVVEPDRADCFYRSALADDGAPHAVDGDLDTMMAGLACGEPSPPAWEILRDYAKGFISCPDETAVLSLIHI